MDRERFDNDKIDKERRINKCGLCSAIINLWFALHSSLDSGIILTMAQASGSNDPGNAFNYDADFMTVAILQSRHSEDPNTKVGACIVNKEKKIVGIGYNKMPRGCEDQSFWNNNKSLYVCHAEFNAVLDKTSSDLKDCTIYVTLFPCNECTKIIIQSGIKEVVFLTKPKNPNLELEKGKKIQAAYTMFEKADITPRKFRSFSVTQLSLLAEDLRSIASRMSSEETDQTEERGE